MNEDGALASNDEDNKIAYKSYHEKFLNQKFPWVEMTMPKGQWLTSVDRIVHHLRNDP